VTHSILIAVWCAVVRWCVQLSAALKHDPILLFNPSWIPGPTLSDEKYPELVRSGWRSAMDLMAVRRHTHLSLSLSVVATLTHWRSSREYDFVCVAPVRSALYCAQTHVRTALSLRS
jgi:hypothetical protein